MKEEVKEIKIPETKEGKKSFDKLVQAAEKLFSEKGYRNTTVKDIAGKAKMSVGGFYIYFDTKYQIYAYIMEKFAKDLQTYLEKKAYDSFDGDRDEVQVKFIMSLIEYVFKNPACYNLIFESLYFDKDLFFNYYYKYAMKYVPALENSNVLPSDVDPMCWAYINMGIGNFLGFKVIAENDGSKENFLKIEKTVRKIIKSGLSK